MATFGTVAYGTVQSRPLKENIGWFNELFTV